MFNKVIYAIGVYFRNNKINGRLAFLQKSQFWPREQLENYQLDQLSILLKRAYDDSPYYKQLFDNADIRPKDIQSFNELKTIPPTSKSSLLSNINTIQSHVANEKQYYSETSGSTGEPLIFYRNQLWDAWHNASVFRGYSWYGIKPWHKNGYLWGYNFSFKKAIIIKIQDVLQNRFRLFTYEPDEIDLFCHKLKNAKYINGYSSMIYEVAKHVEKNPDLIRDINLSLVKGTSEKIFDSYQKSIMNAFGLKMISEYGAAEAGIIAFECPAGQMHVNMETVIVEEDQGSILVTNLTSLSFPIIRYELGDHIILDKTTKCSCGRESHIIKEITGRVGKNIYGKENNYPSLTLYYIFKNIAINHSISLNYLVIQKQKGAIDILFETKLSDAEKGYLDEEIVKYFGRDIDYNIVEERNLFSRNSKKKDFISEIDD